MPSSSHFLLLLLAGLAASQTCYYPDGKPAPRDTPCDPDAEASHCCADGYVCMSAGLCQAVDGAGTSMYARGSCSQQSWSSSNCPDFCTAGEASGGADVVMCQGYTDRFFCPKTQQAKDVCSDPKKALVLSEPTVIRTIGVETSTQPTQSTAPTTTSEAATTTTSSQETTSTPKGDQSSTAASSSPNETGSADEDSTSTSNSALIGGAVGGSIGGFILGGVLVFVLMRFRNKKKEAAWSRGEVEEGRKNNGEPKAEMSAEAAPVELPGYSAEERVHQ